MFILWADWGGGCQGSTGRLLGNGLTDSRGNLPFMDGQPEGLVLGLMVGIMIGCRI